MEFENIKCNNELKWKIQELEMRNNRLQETVSKHEKSDNNKEKGNSND